MCHRELACEHADGPDSGHNCFQLPGVSQQNLEGPDHDDDFLLTGQTLLLTEPFWTFRMTPLALSRISAKAGEKTLNQKQPSATF